MIKGTSCMCKQCVDIFSDFSNAWGRGYHKFPTNMIACTLADDVKTFKSNLRLHKVLSGD